MILQESNEQRVITVRISDDLHSRIKEAAHDNGVSMNTMCIDMFEHCLNESDLNKPLVGDYVLVKSVPAHWDGSGESDEDRESLVGHVGIVCESLPDEEMCHIKFADSKLHSGKVLDESIGFRNVEYQCLTVLSRPKQPITNYIIAN